MRDTLGNETHDPKNVRIPLGKPGAQRAVTRCCDGGVAPDMSPTLRRIGVRAICVVTCLAAATPTWAAPPDESATDSSEAAPSPTEPSYLEPNDSSSPSPDPELAPHPVAPVATATEAAPEPAKRPRRALMITGWSILGTSYLASLAVGVTVYDSVHYETLGDLDPEEAAELNFHIRREDRHAYGRRMSIPVLGPWFAMGKTNSAGSTFGTALVGVVQGTGLVLGVLGTTQFARDMNARRRSSLSFAITPEPGGAQAMMTMRY
jgi:hypothetical protein